MKCIKILLIFFICIPFKLMAQPGALYPSFGQFGITVTTESMSRFENILPLANGQFLVTDHDLAVRYYENGATESYTYSTFWRYNADGTQDLTYGSNGKRRFFSSDVYHQYFTSFAVLTDGRIVATEGVQVLGSSVFSLNKIWIFNSDGTGGSILAELSVFGYFSVNLDAITVDKNNRIVVTGYVRGTSGSDKNRTYIARLLTDGTLDESFNNVGFRVLVENSSYNYSGELVATDANNNIIIVEEGYYGTETGFYISKFLESGAMETGFGNVKANAVVRSLVIDGNSKIIFLDGGNIKRLNTNGTADVTFQPAEFSVKKLVIQPDNKVIAIGSSSTSFKVSRFGTAGNLDPAFGTNGTATTNLNLTAPAQDAIYLNRKLYLSGYIVNTVSYGTIIAYDASDVRMTCPVPQNPYNVDAGKCYATVNNINAVMSSSTLWANVQHKLEYNGTTVEGEGGVAGNQFQIGTTHVTYTYTDITTQTCSFDITVTDQDPPVARCKNITVALDATGNASITAAQIDNGSTDGCGIQSRTLNKTTFNCSNVGANTVTLTVTDVNGNSSTCTATVTVQDNTPPAAMCKNITAYLDAAGSVSITAADVDNGSNDACGAVTLSLSKTTFTCADKGQNSPVLTITDPNGNSATCSPTVTVVDNLPPVITSVVATPGSLWPSDRKMKPVSIAVTATDNCGVYTWRITNVVVKAGAFANDNVNPDSEITGDNTVNLRAEIPKRGIKRVYTVTITCTDASGNSSTSSTDVAVSYNITGPGSGAITRIGSAINLSGEFWDEPGNTHTAKWLIDNSTTLRATVNEPSDNVNGTVAGSYKFNNAGVYKLQMNVTDQNGVTRYATTNENLDAIVVVYDPNGGYTYGGGNFYSPMGALRSNTALAGDVSYGFTVNYYKGAKYPKGEAQFDFKLGDFEFNALNFDYLVISNSMAQFKGTGKIIGGQSGIGFIMTVVDGELDGTGVDKIRMKIYNKNNGQVIYDNQPGASDAALPTHAVGANSVIVIGGGAKSSSVANTEQPIVRIENNLLVESLEVGAFPNPHQGTFSLRIQSPKTGKMTIEYFTMTGARIHSIEQQVKAYEQIVVSNNSLKFNGTVFYKVSIDGIIKTGKIIGIK